MTTINVILFLTALFFVMYAAICNAQMDTVKDHFGTSVYKVRPSQWFNPNLSWTNKDNPSVAKLLGEAYLPIYIRWLVALKPGWAPISDFWHWKKTQMLTSIFLACSLCSLMNLQYWEAGTFFLSAGMFWIIVFNDFYNHILKS